MEEQSPKKPQSSFRGLYKNVKISVGTLDKIIVAGIAVMVILIVIGIANNGYTVTFDSKGGTDVAQVRDLMYGDLIPEPEPPTREGYTFTGWFSDQNCMYEWEFDTMQVGQSFTLYAGWEAVSK